MYKLSGGLSAASTHALFHLLTPLPSTVAYIYNIMRESHSDPTTHPKAKSSKTGFLTQTSHTVSGQFKFKATVSRSRKEIEFELSGSESANNGHYHRSRTNAHILSCMSGPAWSGLKNMTEYTTPQRPNEHKQG